MRISDYIRLLLLAAIWGASFLFMRITVPEIGAINSAFLRVCFGFLGLAIILFILKCPFSFSGRFKFSLAIGIINSGLPFFMYCLAARWLPAGYSAILNATTPLMGALIGCSFFGERLTVRKWTGVILGLAGIMVITTIGRTQSTSGTIAGIITCLVATACYGIAGFLTHRWFSDQKELDPKIIALGSQIGATLFLLPFFAWSVVNNGSSINWLQRNIWLSILASGIICTALAYIIYFRLIADIGPLRSLTVTFLIPPFGILWGYIALGETLSSGYILGALIICISVWLVVSPPKSHKKMK
ncbi:EamA/RhaT family transporter [Erwinia endophytica]|uniref:DMT family transporter n=1 Tax=Erwinia endophytica TaxID=1563158 RepID=UPI001265E179|nr:DMT family transporter [Erwinia endophytica]KAB8306224.1 EamA/RhaT family transporter [Erwinia endophytica]